MEFQKNPESCWKSLHIQIRQNHRAGVFRAQSASSLVDMKKKEIIKQPNLELNLVISNDAQDGRPTNVLQRLLYDRASRIIEAFYDYTERTV